MLMRIVGQRKNYKQATDIMIKELYKNDVVALVKILMVVAQKFGWHNKKKNEKKNDIVPDLA